MELLNIPKEKILVLDTETTGIDDKAEILQLSIIDGTGRTIIDQYFRPEHTASWPEAAAVNGITPDMIKNKPGITSIAERLEKLLADAALIIGYNLPFDLRMLVQAGIALPIERKYLDIMIPFARMYGEWNEFYGDWKWQKLITCAEYCGYTGDGWHNSLADVKATLFCFEQLAEVGLFTDADIY